MAVKTAPRPSRAQPPPLPAAVDAVTELRNGKATPSPVQIVFDLPERTEALTCPGIYAPHTVTLVLNAPDATYADMSMADALARAVKAWTFRLHDGTPAPITAEALQALPPDLYNWLSEEFVARRRRPLVTPSADNSPAPTA
jgi:hypothetical protein